MTQIEALGRILTWFVGQSKTLQSLVLGNLDADDEDSVIGLMHQRQSYLRREARAAEEVLLEADEAVRQTGKTRKSRKNVARAR